MNMQSIMAQAQKMQRDITKKKEEIDSTDFHGKSEWVEVVFNGKKELKNLQILKTDGIDKDEVEILEDMLSIAIKDALKQVDEETEKKLGAYSQSLNGLF